MVGLGVCLTQFTDDCCSGGTGLAGAQLSTAAASVVRSWYKMEHSGTNNYMEQTNSYMSNEDRLFMSQTMSYPGQGSFTLTVQAGQVTSWRPHNLQPMDSLATAMMNMEVQVRHWFN